MLLLPRTVGPFTLLRRVDADHFTEHYLGRSGVQGGVEVRVRRLLPPALEPGDDGHWLDQRIRDLLTVRAPEITTVLDWVSDGSERFVVEEHAGGTGLEQLLARGGAQGGPPRPSVFLHLAVQLCNALDRFHRARGPATGSASVLHLALQPSSVRVDPSGGIRLGTAGLIPASRRLAWPGAMGHVEYLAPEQTHERQELSPATDIFSLGALLHELATTRSLFRAPTELETIDRVRRADISADLAAVRDVLPGLDRILFRALSRNPRHRYQRAFVLREDLRGLMAAYDFRHILEDVQQFVAGTGASNEAGDAEETLIRGAVVLPDLDGGGVDGEEDLVLDAPAEAPAPRVPPVLGSPPLPAPPPPPPLGMERELDLAGALGPRPGPENPRAAAQLEVEPVPLPGLAPVPAPVPALLPVSGPVPAEPRAADATQAPDPRGIRPSTPHVAPGPVSPPPEPLAPPAPQPPNRSRAPESPPAPSPARGTDTGRRAITEGRIGREPRAWFLVAAAGLTIVGGGAWWAATRAQPRSARPALQAPVGASPAQARHDPRLPAVTPTAASPSLGPSVEGRSVEVLPAPVLEAATSLATAPQAPVVASPRPTLEGLAAELDAVPVTRSRRNRSTPGASPASWSSNQPSTAATPPVQTEPGSGPPPDVDFPAASLDLDRLAAAAAAGALTSEDAARLESLPAEDPRHLRALTLVLMDARFRGDRGTAVRLLGRIFERPEAHFSPVLLVERARYAVNGGDYRTGLDAARSAEQHWARLPSALIFSKTAEIYELQAAAAQGLFYRSGGDLALLVAATTAWKRYRSHVAARDRSDLIARADAELAQLEDVRRRTR